MLQYNLQKLSVYDPVTKKIITGINRDLVHLEGLWHLTVQAYVFRVMDGNMQVLVQQRSSFVDIGKNKIDQSLATHVFDNETVEQALERGFFDEFGLQLNSYPITEVFPDHNLFISKTYKENQKIKNRERIKLFFVLISGNEKLKLSLKTDSFFWMNWDDYVYYTKNNPNFVTKTSKFYISNTELFDAVKSRLHLFINRENLSLNKSILKNIHLISLYDRALDIDLELLLESPGNNNPPVVTGNIPLKNSDALYERFLLFDKKFGRIPKIIKEKENL